MVLPTDHFYTSARSLTIPFTVEGEVKDYNVAALPRLCQLSSSQLTCYLDKSLMHFTIAAGFVEGANGMRSETVTFRVTYSAQPLSVGIVWSASPESKTPLRLEFSFTVAVAMDAAALEPYLVLTNGVLNTLKFSGRSGVITVSPLDMDRVTVTMMRSGCGGRG